MSDSKITIDQSYKLIVTIVKRGFGSKVVAASKKAGADGGTILLGKGTARKDAYLDLLGINYEMEKEVVLTFIEENKSSTVLQAITDSVKLNKPGNGVAFIVDIKDFAGIYHLLKIQQTAE